MTVSLSSSSLALANTSTTAAAQEDTTTAALNKISPALGKAHGRVQSQLQSDSTSLSQLGKYKATVSDLSTAAQALSQLGSGTASVADNAKVVERFVAAYNQALTASKPGTSSEASSTLAASRRALTNASTDTSRSQLAKLGLSRQADGTLKLDATALNKVLTASAASSTNAGTTTGSTASSTSTSTSASASGLSTLAQLGKAIGKRADNELTSTSRLATATSLFSGKTSQLKQQQTRLLEAATQMSSQASSGINTGNWSTQQALRKYTV